MKKLGINIEVVRALKPNNHKIDVYIEEKFMDAFGKECTFRKLFDTILPSEKDMIIKQIHNIYGITA